MKSPGGKRTQLHGAPPSVSEIIPTIRMLETREWIRKGSLIPISITLAAVILMEVAAVHDPPWYELYGLMVACFLAMESVHTIYKLCGIRKPLWWLVLIAGTTFLTCRLVATNCAVFTAWSSFTNRLTPEDVLKGTSTIDRFAYFYLSGAVPEEIFKIMPVIIAFLLGRFLSSPWRELLGVREPLDGVLLGSTSAMGFSAAETVYHYFLRLGCPLPGHPTLLPYNAVYLLFPRGLGEVAGHAAYTGFLGYAIGLAIVRPRRRWFTLLSGFVIATLAHALWDAASEDATSYFIPLIVAIACYALLAAAILKAREISPTRANNFATNFMRGLPGDSALPSSSSWKNSTATPVSEAKPPSEPTAPPQSTSQTVTVSDVPSKTAPLAFTFYVAGKVILLTHGFKIMAGDIPGLSASTEDGVLAEVVSSPKHPGEFGLRNSSTLTWKIRLPGGVEGEVPEGKAIRLARGMVFTFGDARGEIL